jgi:acetoin utilization deacetylase AcuC-like enzyme
MTRLVADLARSSAKGRVLSLLEGGYDLEALAGSAQVHMEELKTAGESRDLAA